MNKKTRFVIPCLRAIGSTVAAYGITLVLMGIVSWIWVLHHDPEIGESVRGYFFRCWIIPSVNIAVQFVVLLLADIVIAIVRGRHNSIAGLFSGILLFALDIITVNMGLLPASKAGGPVYLFAWPLLVSALQWWPERRNTEASNQPSQPVAGKPGSD